MNIDTKETAEERAEAIGRGMLDNLLAKVSPTAATAQRFMDGVLDAVKEALHTGDPDNQLEAELERLRETLLEELEA